MGFFDTNQVVNQSVVDAQVSYQQAKELNYSQSFIGSHSLIALFASIVSLVLEPFSFFFEKIEDFQIKLTSWTNQFSTLSDNIFSSFLSADNALAGNSIYDTIKYCCAFDLLTPFLTDVTYPAIYWAVVTVIALAFSIIVILFSAVIFNVCRRIISCTPFFKAV